MFWLSCIVSNIIAASVLALLAWCVQRQLRSFALARILWIFVLIKLITPPLVVVPLGQLPGTWACTLGVCDCERNSAIRSAVGDTVPWLLLSVWSTGAATTAWIAWRRWVRLQRLLTPARSAPAEWQSMTAQISGQLSLRRPPEVRAMPGRLPPMVVAGWGRPQLLLPQDLLHRLNRSQKEALVIHELTHLKHLDHLVRLLELMVGVVYWWLPFASGIRRQLRECEEESCDRAVLNRLPEARREYARLLLDVLDFTAPLSRTRVSAGTAMSSAHDLESRILTILSTTPRKPRPWTAGVFALSLACTILPLQFQYEFWRRPAAAAASAEQATDARAAVAPGGSRPVSVEICCPS